MHLNRTFCDTIAEMRKLIDNMSIFSYFRNKAMLRSLVEECQTYGNRMEAGLYDKHDLRELHKEKARLEAEVKTLRKLTPEQEKPRSRLLNASRLLDDVE